MNYVSPKKGRGDSSGAPDHYPKNTWRKAFFREPPTWPLRPALSAAREPGGSPRAAPRGCTTLPLPGENGGREGDRGLPQPPAWPSAALSSFSSLTRTASPRPELPPRPFPICPRGSQGCVLEPDRGAPDAARTTSAPGLQAPRRPHGVCHPPWVPESRARLCLLSFSSDFRTHCTPS